MVQDESAFGKLEQAALAHLKAIEEAEDWCRQNETVLVIYQRDGKVRVMFMCHNVGGPMGYLGQVNIEAESFVAAVSRARSAKDAITKDDSYLASSDNVLASNNLVGSTATITTPTLPVGWKLS